MASSIWGGSSRFLMLRDKLFVCLSIDIPQQKGPLVTENVCVGLLKVVSSSVYLLKCSDLIRRRLEFLI